MGEMWGEKGLRWTYRGRKNTTKENIGSSLRHEMSNPCAVSQKLLPDKMWKVNPHWWDAGAKNGQITGLSMIIFSNFNWFW